MILTVVGSGTLVPMGRRSAPALLLTEGDEQVSVDGGTGTLRRQAELGFDFRRTTTLCFTHIHLDHTLDLLHFLFASRHAPGGPRSDSPTLIGPPGFERWLDRFRDGVRSWTDGGPAGFRVRELGDREAVRAGSLDIAAFRLEHSVVDHGYRFRCPGGRTAAFTGDTAWCEAAVELARGVDVLVAECSGDADHPVPGHLTAPEAGRLAAAAGANQLVLTHLYPLPDDRDRVRQAALHYDGPVLLAEDGVSFSV